MLIKPNIFLPQKAMVATAKAESVRENQVGRQRWLEEIKQAGR